MGSSPPNAPEDICLTCGLCCNGVIFADLRLQPGDNANRLQALGLPLTVPGRRDKTRALPRVHAVPVGKVKLPQPCAAFDGCRCRIYPDRPKHCRHFECGVLKSLKQRQTQRRTALRLIRSARASTDHVRHLLGEFGDTSEDLPLAARFRRTSRRLQAVGLERSMAHLYGDLTLAVHDLYFLLSEAFYPGEAVHEL